MRGKEEIKSSMYSILPLVIKNVGIAVLIWFLGVLVLIPFSNGIYIYDFPVQKIVSTIMLVSIALILLEIVKQVTITVELLSELGIHYLFPEEIGRKKREVYEQGFKKLGYLVIVLLAYILFLPFLSDISKELAGVLLILLLIWGTIVFYRIFRIFSEKLREKGYKMPVNTKEDE